MPTLPRHYLRAATCNQAKHGPRAWEPNGELWPREMSDAGRCSANGVAGQVLTGTCPASSCDRMTRLTSEGSLFDPRCAHQRKHRSAIMERGRRAHNVPLLGARTVTVSASEGLDPGTHRIRDDLVGCGCLLLVDERGRHAVVAHPVDQVSQARTAGRREGVPGSV